MRIEKAKLVLLAETFAAILLWEILLRAFTLGFAEDGYLFYEILIILMISAFTSVLFVFIKTILPSKAGNIVFSVFVIVYAIFFVAQDVYYAIFETFFTFYSMANGAQVIEFQDVIWAAIGREIVPFIMFLAIAALLIYLAVFDNKEKKQNQVEKNRKYRYSFLSVLLIGAVALGGGFAAASIKSDDPLSPYQHLYGVSDIKGTVKSFGLISAMNMDAARLVFGFEPKIEEANAQAIEADEFDHNIIDGLDFEKLIEAETDDTIKTMHRCFAGMEPTNKNDKTGIFKGKNLIFITAESFTDFAVDPVYTPTLYKLQSEGYTFSNFYTPIWGVSTLDGEYSNLQGLIPKPGVWSMKESKDNYLPFTLGNQFSKIGYQTKAYHNHNVEFYGRTLSHPNLGYDFKGQGAGYSFEETWPESDVEMIDKTTPDFLTPDEDGNIQPFHVYYLTVSGHMNYNFSDNDMAAKNQNMVENLQMSEPCRAYMACNIEFDKSMELLLKRLEEAGQLDNTVIAIAGDHYPYGLKEDAISEFKGHRVDTTYEIYENTFILWTPGMKPERVDKVACNMDILPTLLNMFGFDYDSRLLMGSDIFCDKEGLVVFQDKNWITDKGSREDIIGNDDEYVLEIDRKVAMMVNYSALILDKDYYRHLRI